MESVRFYDDFEVTAESRIKDLRTACALLGILSLVENMQTQRLFGKIREAHIKGLYAGLQWRLPTKSTYKLHIR